LQASAARVLDPYPWCLRALPGGETVVLSRTLDHATLCVFDDDLAEIWSREVDPRAFDVVVSADGEIHLVTPSGVWAVARSGDMEPRFQEDRRSGREIGALAFVGDDMVVALQHAIGAPVAAPTLMRLSCAWTVRWTSVLPMPSPLPWGDSPSIEPSHWVSSYMNAGVLKVSGSCAIAVYRDMPGTGLAMGYVVSLADGTLRHVTAVGPIVDTAPWGDDEVLVSFSGYGRFETWLIDAAGNEARRWDTAGQLTTRDGVVVLEARNGWANRMARLNDDGSIERGDLIDGHEVSTPLVHASGIRVFMSEGTLVAADGVRIVRRQLVHPEAQRRPTSCLVAGWADRLLVAHAMFDDPHAICGLQRLDIAVSTL
jgi:hypothetical protein